MTAPPSRSRLRVPALALAAVTLVTLVAGLYPFSFLRGNRVSWTGAPGGLRFAPGSMALGSRPIAWDTTHGPGELAFELWLEPQQPPVDEDRDILIVLDDPQMPALRIMQAGTDLVVASRVTNADGERWYNDFRYLGVMAGGAERHLALVAAAPQPRLYVDGHAVRPVTGYGIPLARQGEPFSGRLLLGSDPRGSRSWEGTLRGLIVHTSEPAWAAGVPDGGPRAPGQSPSGANAPRVTAAEAAAPSVRAAYAFTEGRGATVADLAGGADAIELPPHVRPVGMPLLGTASRTPMNSLPMFVDAAVNVLGFAPLGFCLLAALLAAAPRAPTLLLVAAAIAIAAATSLGIEALQVLMPTRHSSLLDLQLNTAGAALGVAVSLVRSICRGRQS